MFMRILCATDGSAHGDRALRQAARMALESSGELHVVHVIEWIAAGGRLSSQSVFVDELEVDERIRRQAIGLAGEEGVDAVVHIVRGAAGDHPARHLADLADQVDADLIVIGTRGYAPLAGVMHGSVTQRLLHDAGRPVLALPPEGASARGDDGTARTANKLAI